MACVFGTGLAFLVMVGCLNGVQGSSETLRTITSGFLKVMEACKQELNLNDHIISDFYHYWKEDYALLNRDTGCAIVCMSKKLDLLDSSGKIHHGNAKEFAEKHGADEGVSTKLVAILHECEKTHEALTDECLRALEVAKCFRTGIHQLDWAPRIDVIVTEVLTEM